MPEGTAAPSAAPAAPSTPATTEVAADGSSAGSSPAAKPATPPAQTQAEREEEFELTFNGKAEKWPKSKLIARAQKAEGSDRKFFEAERMQKEAEAKLARLKSEPWKVLEEMGLDPDKAAYERMQKKLEADALTPEQKRVRELEAKLAEHEKAKQSEVEKAEQEKQAAEVARHRDEFADKFSATLEKMGLKPGTVQHAIALGRLAHLELQNAKLGVNLGPDELAAVESDGLESYAASRWEGLEGEALLARVPEALVKRISKAVVERHKKKGAPAPIPAPKVNGTPPRDEKGKFTRDDAWAATFFK